MNDRIGQRKSVSTLLAIAVLVAGGVFVVARLENAPAPLVQGQLPIGEGWALGGITVSRGRVADFTVALNNRTGSNIRLTAASVIAGPDVLTPHLVHLGVFAGNDIVGDGKGWPLRGSYSPIVSFHNYVADIGQTNIAVALSGSKKLTAYGIIGLTVSYVMNGKTFTSRIIGSGGDFCVGNTQMTSVLKECGRKEMAASRLASKLVTS